MNLLCVHSDRLQEYKQKHLERKIAAARELGLKLPYDPANQEEKGSGQETGCGQEAEDGGSPAVENNSESTQEQASVESTAAVSANGLSGEPAEQNQHEEKTHAGVDSEVKMINGESEVRAAGHETETSAQNGVKSSAANGEMKSDATCEEMKSDEKDGEINRTGDIAVRPSALKSKGTWADVVVSQAVNGGVNGVADDVKANGVAKE